MKLYIICSEIYATELASLLEGIPEIELYAPDEIIDIMEHINTDIRKQHKKYFFCDNEWEQIQNELTQSGLRGRMTSYEFSIVFLARKANGSIITDYPFLVKYTNNLDINIMDITTIYTLRAAERNAKKRSKSLNSAIQLKLMFN